jgi:hypothetical protein
MPGTLKGNLVVISEMDVIRKMCWEITAKWRFRVGFNCMQCNKVLLYLVKSLFCVHIKWGSSQTGTKILKPLW